MTWKQRRNAGEKLTLTSLNGSWEPTLLLLHVYNFSSGDPFSQIKINKPKRLRL